MDINDMVSMQPETIAESTLESEIDALSKIITDTKDGSQKSEDNDEDFKLINDDIAFNTALQFDSAESDKCELLQNDDLGIKDILDNSAELENFISASTSKINTQELSEAASKTVENVKNNDNVSQNIIENYDISIAPFETISQENKIESIIEKESFIVNDNISLIDEAYSLQESQNYLQNQSMLVSQIEQVNELMNDTVTEDVTNEMENKNIFQTTVKNHDASTSSNLLIEVDEKFDSAVEHIATRKLNNEIIQESTTHSSMEQKNKTEINDQSNIISTSINFNENEENSIKKCSEDNSLKESSSLVNIEKNDSHKESIKKETALEIESLNDDKKIDVEQQKYPISNEIKVTKEMNDSIEKIIIKQNEEIEVACNANKIQLEIAKSNDDPLKEKVHQIETNANIIEAKSTEFNILFSEVKDCVETNKESAVIVPQSCEQNIENINLENNKINDDIEILCKNKVTTPEKTVENQISSSENETVKIADIDFNSQSKQLEKNLESELVNLDEPTITDTIYIAQNVEATVSKNNEIIEAIDTDEISKTTNFDEKNEDRNNDLETDILYNTKEERNIINLQKIETNVITNEIQNSESDEKINNLERISMQTNIDTSQNIEAADVDFVHKTDNVIDLLEIVKDSQKIIEAENKIKSEKNIENLKKQNIITETSQERTTDDIESIEKIETLENLNSNIKDVKVQQVIESNIIKSSEDIENLDNLNLNRSDKNLEETKIDVIKSTDNLNLEKPNIRTDEIQYSEETKTDFLNNLNSNILNITTLEESKADIIENIKNLENSSTSTLDQILKEPKINIEANENKANLENLNVSTKEIQIFEEIKTDIIEPIEKKINLDEPNISAEDLQASNETKLISNNKLIEVSENSDNSCVVEASMKVLNEISAINNTLLIENTANVENQDINIESIEALEKIKAVSSEAISENIDNSENSSIIKNNEDTKKCVENVQTIEISTNIVTMDTTESNEIPEDITNVITTINKNSSENDKILKDDKSLKEMDIENAHVTEMKKNIDETNILKFESDSVKDEENSNMQDIEKNESKQEENKMNNVENIKETMKSETNLITISDFQNDNILDKNTHEFENKNLPDLENESDQIIKHLDGNEIENEDSEDQLKNNLNTEHQMIESSMPARIETPEDLNITLELEEPEVLEKVHFIETKEIKIAEELKSEENITNDEFHKKEILIETNLEAQEIQKEMEQVIDNEETEDPLDINLSLDPDEYSSPIIQESPEMQTVLDDPLDEFIGNQNISTVGIQETPEIEEDLSEILNINKKVDEVVNEDNQDSDTQELATRILNEVEKELGSELNELLKTEEHLSNEVENFDDSECLSLSVKNLQSLDEKSQDSLSILEALQNETISIEQDKIENKEIEPVEKEEDITLMLEESSQSPKQSQNDKFANDFYDKSITNNVLETKDAVLKNIMECNEPVFDKQQGIEENVEKEIEENKSVENLALSLEGEKNTEIKIKTMESSAEISEVESAVKFLQESEECEIENAVIENIVTSEESSRVFVSIEENICDNTSELESDIPEIIMDPIAISEAELICEATKLENERKKEMELNQQCKSSLESSTDQSSMNKMEASSLPATDLSRIDEPNDPLNIITSISKEEISSKVSLIKETKLKSKPLPKAAIVDDRYKVPPQIEIPEVSPKICDLPTTPKSSLLIQKDAKLRLESPDRQSSHEPKITDTPKKDVCDKQQQQQQQQQYLECENVGSPRIILKIAKSAIADCSEPRSPKSPKIRSAANSPNPEDSPGHKLGKIKLKLSKGGHPSIISSSDNYDESVAQWHTDSTTSSLSPLGVKIKLTKSSDTSLAESKHEETQKQDETKEKISHKTEDRKAETSIGMKIKFSKSGDASIVQQDSSPKDTSTQKHKDSKEVTQETSAAKKQDSPSIGMKIKLSKSGDASIIQQDNKTQSEDYKETSKAKDKVFEDVQEGTRQTESPIGMKIKLSKSGDASVIANEPLESNKEIQEMKEKAEESLKRTDSPIGVKIKLSKTKDGNASIIPNESLEEAKEKVDIIESSKKTKSSKKREASEENRELKTENLETDVSKVQETNKAKITKSLSAEDDQSSLAVDENLKATIGMKIKLSKTGDASVVHAKKEDSPIDAIKKNIEQPIGMKIKLSKTGDPSIIHPEISKEAEDVSHNMKIKLSKNKDHGTASQQKAKDDSHLEMKIKLSKTGHATIVTNDLQEDSLKISNLAQTHKYKDHKDLLTFKESTLKAIKKSHTDVTIEPVKNQSIENTMLDLHNKRKEITIAPIESKKSKIETNLKQMLPDVTIQPITPVMKKEPQQLQHPQQPQQKLVLESNSGSISRQQMNVINQEISITQVCSLATGDTLMGERLKNALNSQTEASSSSPLNSDCEIIEPQPELIIVNENSNSSQDVMIIDEVPSVKSTAKTPKKRGRPRRNAVAMAAAVSSVPVTSFDEIELQRDPLSLDQPPIPILQSQIPAQMQQIQVQHQQQQLPSIHPLQPQIIPGSVEGSERPRRTCRSQKSYAPPKRGRGRGRGKRKNESVDSPMKKARIDQDLTAIENATTAVIPFEELAVEPSTNLNNTSELFKALNQPTLNQIVEKQSREIGILKVPESMQTSSECQNLDMMLQKEVREPIQEVQDIALDVEKMSEIEVKTISDVSAAMVVTSITLQKEIKEITEVPKITIIEDESTEKNDIGIIKTTADETKVSEAIEAGLISDAGKEPSTIQENQNWLAPSIKKVSGEPTRTESISTLTVIDEETRMSAESGSRSQTPARSVSVPGTSETMVNEESQGSTATTESEKVKVKIRRMEISFDPDEGPFTVEKIAEYEWPLERKEDRPAGRGETFMIQEQISQYLGVKSFKRKYPDLKRRMVDMEERNFLRENGLVSESMCDMGLTAVSSSEVLDIMCSDFPEQYEEYRKHMREKAAREHSKKQKELSAAANAERTRIDLAEMAMQSALAWNAGLNKTRQDSRKCSLDLQTFTVHVPKRPVKPHSGKRGCHYPVALVPGQYTDYYREYTPAELRYYPLNTVLYGPMRPNERKFDSQSEGSQSDSDSDSSSDDSSSSSSEGTQDTEGSQSTMDEVDMELALQSDVKCKMCMNNLNKNNRPEVLIQCGTCTGNVHPSCIDLTLDMVPHIRAYAWQCTDCKTCAQCHDPADEDKMLFCDMCDRGYHIYCVGLRRVPQGRWHCQECAVCANCGSKEPGGVNSDRNSVAQWQHEYKKGDKNTRVYVSTFCVPCSKLRGNQGVDN